MAAADPITDQTNLMYAVHFYAATHKDDLRNKVQSALDSGLPVFVSEFGLCDASGNGSIDYDQSDAWFDLIDDKNLSYAAWNISNKAETSSLFDSSCTKKSGFTDDDNSIRRIFSYDRDDRFRIALYGIPGCSPIRFICDLIDHISVRSIFL